MWIIVQVECNAKLTSMMTVNGAKNLGKEYLQENDSRYSSTPRYSKGPPGKLTKLRGGQEWKDK